MIIKVIDPDTLEKRHAYWGYNPSFEKTYEVLAIKKKNKKKQFLVDDNMELHWWDADLFVIIEDLIPKEWIEIRYKFFHRLKNKKYDFNIPINYYCGPKSFIEDADFMFDIYEYRGAALREKLEEMLSEGDVAAIIYSNPNNPAWICLEEEELAIIGSLATKYDVVVLEEALDCDP